MSNFSAVPLATSYLPLFTVDSHKLTALHLTATNHSQLMPTSSALDNTQASATSFCHKLLSQASVTSFCHKLLSQASATSYCHKLLSQASPTSFCHKLLPQASPTSYCHKLLPQAEGNPLMGTEGSQASDCWPLQPLCIDRASESSHTVTKVSKLLYFMFAQHATRYRGGLL